MNTIYLKRKDEVNFSNFIDVLNSHPNINWQTPKTKDKNLIPFEFFDDVSYRNAKKIIKLLK